MGLERYSFKKFEFEQTFVSTNQLNKRRRKLKRVLSKFNLVLILFYVFFFFMYIIKRESHDFLCNLV